MILACTVWSLTGLKQWIWPWKTQCSSWWHLLLFHAADELLMKCWKIIYWWTTDELLEGILMNYWWIYMNLLQQLGLHPRWSWGFNLFQRSPRGRCPSLLQAQGCEERNRSHVRCLAEQGHAWSFPCHGCHLWHTSCAAPVWSWLTTYMVDIPTGYGRCGRYTNLQF